MDELEVKRETQKHIDNVEKCLRIVIDKLIYRGMNHDRSKLEEPEFTTFKVYTEKLAGVTYGSDEYKQYLKEMQVALDHHYAKNCHHPEHYKNGIDDMDIIDIIEMLCDWKSATLRHNDGNINKSIDHNAERFNMSPQLKRIFENSVRLFEDVK